MQYFLSTLSGWITLGLGFCVVITIGMTATTIRCILDGDIKHAATSGALAVLGFILVVSIFAAIIVNAIFYTAGSVG